MQQNVTAVSVARLTPTRHEVFCENEKVRVCVCFVGMRESVYVCVYVSEWVSECIWLGECECEIERKRSFGRNFCAKDDKNFPARIFASVKHQS